MRISEFIQLFSQRKQNLAWFLGAGASAAGGIPTAGEMIWDFKRQIYCAEQKVHVAQFGDLSDPDNRRRLQSYFTNKGTFPPLGSIDEYAFYFEFFLGDEGDRRRYIEGLIGRGKPSYGHLVLASLLKLSHTRVVWTTNFDRLIEDATFAAFGNTRSLIVADLDHSAVFMQGLNEGRGPLLGKLHGDFQSRRLRNTREELARQDAELRRGLIETCRRLGVCIMGYSGRDQSVMDALFDGIEEGRGFPFGLFWFHRADNAVLPRVGDLIDSAKSKGIQAEIVEVETFDEVMGDLLVLDETAPEEIRVLLSSRKQRASDAPLSNAKGGWPVLRFAALRILSWPPSARLVECERDIGGVANVRNAVKAAGANIVATRKKQGILVFGSDEEARKVFGSFSIKRLDVFPLEERRLRYESMELGLLYEAVARAFARVRPVIAARRGRSYLLVVDSKQVGDPAYQKLKASEGAITGKTRTGIGWADAVRVRLQHRLDRFWLLIEPAIWLDLPPETELDDTSKEFVRSRLAGRFNRKWNDVLEGWLDVLIGPSQEQIDVQTFGISDGIDGKFVVSRGTAFARTRA